MPYPIKNQPPTGAFSFPQGLPPPPPPGRRTIYNLLQDLPRRRRKQTITLIPPKQTKPLSTNPQNQALALLSHPKTGKSPFSQTLKTKGLPSPPTPKQAKPLSHKPSKPSACPLRPPQSRQSPFLQILKTKRLPPPPTPKQAKPLSANPQNQGLALSAHPKAGEDSPPAQKFEWEVKKEKRPRMPEAPFLFSWEGVLCYSR